jgi:uncharacterized lipoprotein YmbA
MILVRHRVFGACAALAAALGGCASAPVHYYTLVAADPQGFVAAGAGAAVQFEIDGPSVPAAMDQPQLVVREGGERVDMLEDQRWIAPLGDEVHAALAADLTRGLPGRDVTALGAGGQPVLRIKVELHRFESVVGAYALIDAAWSLRLVNPGAAPDSAARAAAGGSRLTCTATIREPVGPGIDALVGGHQRALGRLAAAIAASAGSYLSGPPGQCP